MIHLFIAAVLVLLVIIALTIKYLPVMVRVFLNVRVVSPDKFGTPKGDEVTFKSLDGVDLKGYFIKASDEGRQTIIFAHEVGSSAGSWERYCRFLPDAGYNVFTFDFRGHGASSNLEGYSPTQWPSTYEIEDILGAIMYVRARPDVGDIALFGVSRGAATCLSVANLDGYVKAVISDSAYSTEVVVSIYQRKWISMLIPRPFLNKRIPSLFYAYMRFLVLKFAEHRLRCRLISVEKRVRSLSNPPVLIIHGEYDSYIGPENAHRLFDRASGPKELWVVPGAKHNGAVIVAPKEYKKRVLKFLSRYLSKERVKPAPKRKAKAVT